MKLWQKILIGMAVGTLAGVFLGEQAAIFEPLGTIFISLVKMIVVPLIFFSVISGVTALNDTRKISRVGLKTMAVYIFSTILAVSIGLIVGNLLEPGAGIEIEFTSTQETNSETITLKDRILNIIPTNPVASLADGKVLQIIFFAVFLGISIMLTGKKGEKIADMCDSMAHVMYKMTQVIMRFTPYGVFGIMAWVTATHGLSILLPLIKLLIVTFAAYFVHVIFVYGAIIKYYIGLSPKVFLKKIFEVQLVAFTTSSSSATLPVTMRVAEEDIGVSKSSSSFVLPLGATINMDGTSIYFAICALFTAQAAGIELGVNEYMTLILTATLISIGTATAPSAGFALLAVVLSSVNLPLGSIALIAAVDRLLDMGRTTVNVTGDSMVAVLIDKGEGSFNEKVYNKA